MTIPSVGDAALWQQNQQDPKSWTQSGQFKPFAGHVQLNVQALQQLLQMAQTGQIQVDQQGRIRLKVNFFVNTDRQTGQPQYMTNPKAAHYRGQILFPQASQPAQVQGQMQYGQQPVMYGQPQPTPMYQQQQPVYDPNQQQYGQVPPRVTNQNTQRRTF